MPGRAGRKEWGRATGVVRGDNGTSARRGSGGPAQDPRLIAPAEAGAQERRALTWRESPGHAPALEGDCNERHNDLARHGPVPTWTRGCCPPTSTPTRTCCRTWSGRSSSPVREFLRKHVAPIVDDHWARAEFPFQLIGGFGGLGLMDWADPDSPESKPSNLLAGFIALELAHVDASVATFAGVHTGLAMGTILTCGSDEQKRRWLPAMTASRRSAPSG